MHWQGSHGRKSRHEDFVLAREFMVRKVRREIFIEHF